MVAPATGAAISVKVEAAIAIPPAKVIRRITYFFFFFFLHFAAAAAPFLPFAFFFLHFFFVARVSASVWESG